MIKNSKFQRQSSEKIARREVVKKDLKSNNALSSKNSNNALSSKNSNLSKMASAKNRGSNDYLQSVNQ